MRDFHIYGESDFFFLNEIQALCYDFNLFNKIFLDFLSNQTESLLFMFPYKMGNLLIKKMLGQILDKKIIYD